jgi:HicB family
MNRNYDQKANLKMTIFDPNAYRITIQRKAIDKTLYFVGTVGELPDVEVYEDSYQEAYSALTTIISDLKATADAHGRLFPLPLAPVDASGRVTLRLPKSLHAKAAQLADQDGVSLNQWLVCAITENVGGKTSARITSPITAATDAGKQQIVWKDFGSRTSAGESSILSGAKKSVPTSMLTTGGTSTSRSHTVN